LILDESDVLSYILKVFGHPNIKKYFCPGSLYN
jgi:hypothetical protein